MEYSHHVHRHLICMLQGPSSFACHSHTTLMPLYAYYVSVHSILVHAHECACTLMCMHTPVSMDAEVITPVSMDAEVITHVSMDAEVMTHVSMDAEVITHVSMECITCGCLLT